MVVHKKIEITIQTEQVLSIRRRGCSRRWCPECGRDVEVLNLAHVEALTSIAQPRSRDCAKAKQWHALEDADGTMFICLDSLLKAM